MSFDFESVLLNAEAAEQKMNTLKKEGIPFLFVLSFLGDKALVEPLSDIDSREIMYKLPGFTNMHSHVPYPAPSITAQPVSYKEYLSVFNKAKKALQAGESYLLNLTFATPIITEAELPELFSASVAPFKLFVNNQFVVFSPEQFINVKGDEISTFPMKGTIDAAIPDAEHLILTNKKEMAEHATITDLLRNDLNCIAEKTEVLRYRYTETIPTTHRNLIQVSSHIRAKIASDLNEKPGTMLYTLLPAGSICGAPKKRTVEIITEIETYQRGFYTGVFGVCSGDTITSAVMIRFIEKTTEGLVYKSGGGITTQSNPNHEYQEMIDKVYVPVS